MSLLKVLTTAAVSAAIAGAGVLTAPIAQAAEKPSTAITAPTQESAQTAYIWQPTGEVYTTLRRCNASGTYWYNNRPDVVDWDCRLRSGKYYLYLLIDTELAARS
ncbi:hypothetical protein JNUCC64_32205 [Streptomyces sp. JNUCC 64]